MKKETLKQLTKDMQMRIKLLNDLNYSVRWFYYNKTTSYDKNKTIETKCEICKKDPSGDGICPVYTGIAYKHPIDTQNLKYACFLSFMRAYKNFTGRE